MNQKRYFCTKYFTECVINLILHNLTKPSLTLPTTYEPTTYITKAYLTAAFTLKTNQFIWCLATIAITQSYHYLVQTYRFRDVKVLLP